jgi:hypothetical protein
VIEPGRPKPKKLGFELRAKFRRYWRAIRRLIRRGGVMLSIVPMLALITP